MATWITHIRIGENLLTETLSKADFIAGNIGPDSGVPNEDCSEFNPPRNITHWKDEKKNVDSESFYNIYLKNHSRENVFEYSFYLGYYVHLITDVLWTDFHKEIKLKKGYGEELKNNPSFIWTVKKDWYGLDYAYLEKNPNSIFFNCFCKINKIQDYLEYFPEGAFTISVANIKKYYLGVNEETKENFIYLTPLEMDAFVENATKDIREMLIYRNLI